MVYKWIKNKLSGLIQHYCLLCLAATENNYLLCSGCENDLPVNQPHCIVCASPLAADFALVCAQCQQTPPQYQTSFIPYLYASPLKELISDFKFHRNLSAAPVLAHIFSQSILLRKSKLPECIIPMPLHKQRLRSRGFNQALELSRIIAQQLRIPVDYSLCQRTKSTPYQSGLSAKERKENLKNAFILSRPHLYKHVAIFDDVVTTGTSVNELAKELRKSGVKIIEVWALARTRVKNTP